MNGDVQRPSLDRKRRFEDGYRVKSVMKRWRRTLTLVLSYYESRRGPLGPFLARLFLFFTLLNAGCYWLGLVVAYPDKLVGDDRLHYVLLQFPVGLLGALFDTASFFITVELVRRALRAEKAWEYIAHLSVDLVIAVLATFWVLFVFAAAGWIMSYVEAAPESMGDRTKLYGDRLSSALRDPGRNWRNLYFGAVMGISASLPTLFHLALFLRSYLAKPKEQGSSA